MKRVIAREFLILVGLFLCAFVFWITLIGWNTWLEKNKDEVSEQISQTNKDIQLITEKHNIEYDEFGIAIKPSSKWVPPPGDEVVDEDSILQKLNKRNDPLGILKKLRKKKEPTNSTIDSLNTLLSRLNLQKEKFNLNERQFRYNTSNLSSYMLTFIILIVIIVYPIRFLILSVKWSIKTLKSTDKNEV